MDEGRSQTSKGSLIMKILITGSSNGIGLATANMFLRRGFEVVGLDLLPCSIEHNKYTHYICDVSEKDQLPDVDDVNILFVNAGLQNSKDDIKNNLYSAIFTIEKYGLKSSIKSILLNASVSAHSGFEFTEYVCSKGGMLALMKNTAVKVAKYGATCNSLSCGGVLTDLNKPVIEDKKLWGEIMEVTPLKKWATAEEIADWVYFMTIVNKSCTGQDLIIDNGEKDLNCTFRWPDYK